MSSTNFQPSGRCLCLSAAKDISAFRGNTSVITSGSLCQALVQKNGEHTLCGKPLTTAEYSSRFSLHSNATLAVCNNHAYQLSLHQVCPVCNSFIDGGKFARCGGADGKASHFFHFSCLTKTLPENESFPVWSPDECPHCSKHIPDKTSLEINAVPFPERRC